jgi:xanthine dehydrogenase YagS FAD-binding subunit
MRRFAFANATTITEALGGAATTVADAMSRSSDSPVLMAGGIDLLDLLKENLLAPATVVNLRQIPGLDVVADEVGGGLRIGSTTTLASLAEEPRLRERYPALADALRGSAKRSQFFCDQMLPSSVGFRHAISICNSFCASHCPV